MDRDPERFRLERAQLVNDQADSMEKKTLTDAERRECEERQKRINELCVALPRIAARTHTDAVTRS
jgi:hypothetical protein